MCNEEKMLRARARAAAAPRVRERNTVCRAAASKRGNNERESHLTHAMTTGYSREEDCCCCAAANVCAALIPLRARGKRTNVRRPSLACCRYTHNRARESEHVSAFSVHYGGDREGERENGY